MITRFSAQKIFFTYNKNK